MKKVLAFGTFDILHPGHKKFLQQSKKLGDFLTVVVARDKTVRKVKKAFPQNNEGVRLKKVQALKFVDLAVLGYLKDPYKIIEKIKPDVIVLGYDQKTFTENLKQKLKKRKIHCQIVRLKSHHPEKYKSSLLKNHFRYS